MSIEDMLSYSKAKMTKQEENQALTTLDAALDSFFWGLNTDQHYEENSYGGVVERGFHPSALPGAACARSLVYEWLGVKVDDRMQDETTIDPKLRRIFDNGHSLHDRWQRYMTLLGMVNDQIEFVGDWKCKGCGYLLSPGSEISSREANENICPRCGSARWKYNEFRLRKTDLRLVGKRDGKIIIDGEPYLFEIKSINTFQFKKLAAPLPEHVKQFTLYMLMDGTKQGIFLYEDKNSQDYKMFLLRYDSANIAQELKVLTDANKGIDSQTLPDRFEGYPEVVNCKRCVFRRTCEAGMTYAELSALAKSDGEKST